MSQEIPAAPGSAAIVEPATWRDLSSLRNLEQICFPLDVWPLLDLVGVLSFPGVVRLKASHDGKMVGFIAADIRRREKTAWISTLGVLPDYRRKGIATALLKACEERIQVVRIRLSVRASNEPALRLYTRVGYRQYGIWARYYVDGEDALIFEKSL
ncbi:MAG: GNAT family N-acetyltransferase [Chloroflexota bacterium]|nr:MAG: GNAT family N-acetyltransferase [Chloroflexota bacterium]